jgi:hypothetical protein
VVRRDLHFFVVLEGQVAVVQETDCGLRFRRDAHRVYEPERSPTSSNPPASITPLIPETRDDTRTSAAGSLITALVIRSAARGRRTEPDHG